MGNAPEEEYKALIASNDTKKTTEEVQAVFENLKPVEPDFLIGKWKGADFDTGHPVHQGLLDMNWAGKDFRSANDVDPIMVYDENKKRVWFEKRGHAQLRKIEFNGVLSTCMVYDDYPILDHFRYVDDNTVAGAMDSKQLAQFGLYHFFLFRIPESTKL